MVDSITLAVRDDNSADDAEKIVVWARKHKGADAHIVFDYMIQGNVGVKGALNGVTVQWDHNDDGVADNAVHVRPGQTVTRAGDGFVVSGDAAAAEVLV